MEVIYENATKNDEALKRLFVFNKPTDVSYNGEVYHNRGAISLSVKRKVMVKATSHPAEIRIVPDTKGLRK